jgi:hypothetical protein
MPIREIVCGLAAMASIAIGAPASASAWNYGCKGAIPFFNESEMIIFNRDLLVIQPKAWLTGKLRDLVARDPVDDVVAIAKAVNTNSGFAPKMEFTLLENLDKKLTLTEKSSKTISDARQRAGSQPRNAQTTVYTKVYGAVSDFGYLTPFDIKMDCIEFQLSAPIR